MFLILLILFKDVATTNRPDFTTATPFHPTSGMLMSKTASKLQCRDILLTFIPNVCLGIFLFKNSQIATGQSPPNMIIILNAKMGVFAKDFLII